MVTKAKAAGSRFKLSRTGGGTMPPELLTDPADQRILIVIGKVCVDGVKDGIDLNEIVLQKFVGWYHLFSYLFIYSSTTV